MKAIYVAVAIFDHEGEASIKAFASKARAVTLAEKCAKHETKKPRCPPVEDGPENDAKWEKWRDSFERWKKRHPGGECAESADSFFVREVPFDGRP